MTLLHVGPSNSDTCAVHRRDKDMIAPLTHRVYIILILLVLNRFSKK